MRWQNLWLLLCCFSLPVAADTVWLKNGDRLTGTIVLLEDGKLVLSTKYAGRILIDWADVSTLRSEQALLVKQSGFVTEESKSLVAAGEGMVRLENHQSKTLPLADITEIVPPRPFIEDFVWEGNLDGKLNLDRDEDHTDDVRLKLDSSIKHDRWRYSLDASQRYERENGKTSENNWETDYDQDYFFTDQWFVRGTYNEFRDQFEYVDRQTGYALGPGFRFWDNALGSFELIPQFAHIKLQSADGDQSFNAASLSWDYKRLIWGSRVEFYSSGEAATPFIDEVDYVLDTDAGLRYRINDWARISLLYELNQVRGIGKSSSEQEFTIGVGVGW